MSSVVKLFLDPTGLIFRHLSVSHGEPGMVKKKLINMSENMNTQGTLVLHCSRFVRADVGCLHCCFTKTYVHLSI